MWNRHPVQLPGARFLPRPSSARFLPSLQALYLPHGTALIKALAKRIHRHRLALIPAFLLDQLPIPNREKTVMIQALPFLILNLCQPAANPPANPPTTQVMVLGVFHMNNPNRDLVNPTVKDVLGPRRQKEIEELVSRLEQFRPTKIALETPVGNRKIQDRLDCYLAGKYTLTADERDQVGLRLAKRLGHTEIYGIDFKEDLDFDSVFRYAKENGQGDLVQKLFTEFDATIKPKLESGYMEAHTVREILVEANLPEFLNLGHRFYVGLLRVGKADKYPGTGLVSRWYDRNLKIATNVARLSEEKAERILVIIGAGHAKLVRQFLSELPGFEVIDCNRILQ